VSPGSAPRKHPSAHIVADDRAKPAVMVEPFPDLAERCLQCRRVSDDAAADGRRPDLPSQSLPKAAEEIMQFILNAIDLSG